MRKFKNVYEWSAEGKAYVGEIIILNGQRVKVVEVNEDVPARFRKLNKVERFGLWLAGLDN